MASISISTPNGTGAAADQGRSNTGGFGPSDSSDSGSDAIDETTQAQREGNSDRAGTGERASADPMEEGEGGTDILPNRIVRLDGDEDLSQAEMEGADGLADLEKDSGKND